MIDQTMMKRPFAALILLAMITASALQTKDASAVIYEVGVRSGQWASYSVLGGWDISPSNASVQMPQAVRDARNTEYINMSVESVSLKTVTLARTTQFKNNTKAFALISGNVETGEGALNFTVVSRDLAVGDGIIIGPEPHMRITLIERRTYANAERTVNYANITESTISSNRWHEFRWDKTTGILVAMRLFQQDSTEEYSAISSIIVSMKSTNMWEPRVSSWLDVVWSYGSGILIASVIIIAAGLTGYAVFRKPKKHGTTRRLRTRLSHESIRLY